MIARTLLLALLAPALALAASTTATPVTASGSLRSANASTGNASTTTTKHPHAPIRNHNPMKIGIIGGVGPQAGADVLMKVIEEGGQNPFFYQARDMPDITLRSVPKVSGSLYIFLSLSLNLAPS